MDQNEANMIYESIGVGKMPAWMTTPKSTTAGINTFLTPHEGKREVARRAKWHTQITYAPVSAEGYRADAPKTGGVETGLKYFNRKIKARVENEKYHEAC